MRKLFLTKRSQQRSGLPERGLPESVDVTKALQPTVSPRALQRPVAAGLSVYEGQRELFSQERRCRGKTAECYGLGLHDVAPA